MGGFEGVHPALLASFAAALVASAGVFITLFRTEWAKRHGDSFTAFAAGLLVATAVLHLVPESISTTPWAPWLILAGYIGLFFTGILFAVTEPAGERKGLSVAAPILGIGFHSFVDGLEYPVLFEYDVFAGFMAVSGLIIHELAEGVIVFGLLTKRHVGTSLAVVIALIASAFTTPLGAFISLQFVDALSPQTIGALMSLAAGALLFVGASQLPQRIVDRGHIGLWPYFMFGAAIAAMLTLMHGLEGGHVH